MSVISSTRPSAPASTSTSRMLARPGGRIRVREGDPRDAVRCRLLEQQLPARRGREAHDLELGIALDDVQGLRAYGAGRADYEDPAHQAESREGSDPGRGQTHAYPSATAA